MSDTPREPDLSIGGAAVDQGARSQTVDDHVQTEQDVVETLRRQLEELEGAGAEKDKALEAERRRAADAERARQDAESRARQADQQAQQVTRDSARTTAEAQLDAIKNALTAHEGEMTALEAAYASAQAEGDFAASAKVQRQMAVIGGRMAQLETGRDQLDHRIKTAPVDDAQQQQQQASPSEQREAYIRTMPSRVQDWLRGPNGDRYFNDRGFQQKIAAAAAYASNVKSISPDSDQYIEFIETEVGLRQAAPPSAGQQQLQNGQGRTADANADGGRRMTTAPAGGSTAGSVRSNADGSTTVYLTPAEKEQARRDGISEADWARAKRDLLNDGLIGPSARR